MIHPVGDSDNYSYYETSYISIRDDLSKFFNLSKIFALPETLFKSINCCNRNTADELLTQICLTDNCNIFSYLCTLKKNAVKIHDSTLQSLTGKYRFFREICIQGN